MFQFPAFPSIKWIVEFELHSVSRCQIPPGHSLFGSSPRLFAAYHVFHRLWTPRHPPYTLRSLTTSSCIRVITTFASNSPCFQRTKAGSDSRHLLLFCVLSSSSVTLAVLRPTLASLLGRWWRRRDSNPRPPGCKPGALPTELRPR
jgi:hypothetical protein